MLDSGARSESHWSHLRITQQDVELQVRLPPGTELRFSDWSPGAPRLSLGVIVVRGHKSRDLLRRQHPSVRARAQTLCLLRIQ